jgi:hypothetical protein
MDNLNATALPAKKAWCKPEIILISGNSVNGGTRNTAHEASFTPIPGQPGKFHRNGGVTTYSQITFDSFVS